MKGTVKFFNEVKGFGFIKAEDEKEYFVHMSGIKANKELEENQNVEFDLGQNDKGAIAINVVVVEDSSEDSSEEKEE